MPSEGLVPDPEKETNTQTKPMSVEDAVNSVIPDDYIVQVGDDDWDRDRVISVIHAGQRWSGLIRGRETVATVLIPNAMDPGCYCHEDLCYGDGIVVFYVDKTSHTDRRTYLAEQVNEFLKKWRPIDPSHGDGEDTDGGICVIDGVVVHSPHTYEDSKKRGV